MAKTNKTLNRGQKNKNDEFYNVEEEVEKELVLRSKDLNGANVFCNCNDAAHRGFVNCLIRHFHEFGIKSLKYSEYGEGNQNGKIYYYDGEKETVENLDRKGDFSKGRCLEEFVKSDVIITGPPYTRTREFVSKLLNFDKKFLIVIDINHFSYKEIFNPFFEGEMWLGVNSPREFKVPSWYEDTTVHIGKDGEKRVSLNKEVWVTNMGENYPKPFYPLKYSFDETKYNKCDNFDAIWIDDIRNIPNDYEGVMCVPISFLIHYCESQFEVLGLADNNDRVKAYNIINCEKYDRPYYMGERKIYRLLIKKRI
jgi:hypothetical protein